MKHVMISTILAALTATVLLTGCGSESAATSSGSADNSSNAAPAANAPTLHRLEPNPSFVMDSSPLQLNPWNKRVKDKVANAMVLAVLASVCKPIPKAASDAAPIKMP